MDTMRIRANLLTVAAAVLAAAPARTYDDIQFLPPIPLEETTKPVAVAASAERYYVLDEKKGALYLYGADGKFLKAVGRSGSEKTAFSGPKGLAVGPDGRVYVADTGNSRVQVLDPSGGFVTSFGVKGSEPGRLRHPQSLAVGADGRVYVADTGNERVQVFTPDGVYLFGFGAKGKEPGLFRGPTRVLVDPADSIYVLDSGNERIQKFDHKARPVKDFNLIGADAVVDAYGYFYVLDPGSYKVREMDPGGMMQGAFGARGAGKGQFQAPVHVTLGPEGTLLVVDRGTKRLHRIALTSKQKTAPLPPSPAAKLSVSGPVGVWPLAAAALAACGDCGAGGQLYAYLPKEGLFAIIDKDGKAQKRFGSMTGKGPEVTRGSRGLAAHPKHGLFVADTDGDKLQRFSADGTFAANFAETTGLFGKGKEGRVRSPRGMAVNGKGMVYAANAGNRRVEVFSSDGTFLFAIGPTLGPHELKEPVAVAWDESGFVYVLDAGLKKLFKCEPSGGLVLAWGEEGTGPGQLQEPEALTFDGRSYLYVLDRGARRVAVFGKDGAWVTNFFAGGDDERSLGDPASIAVLAERLFVSDPGKGRVLAFALHPRLAPPPGLTAAAADGVARLRWKPSPDAWIEQYRVERASSAAGPYAAVGTAAATELKDSGLTSYATYYYRVASEAKTGDVGPASASLEVFVPGAFNRAPIEIAAVEIGDIFSASYKYYEKNPVGSLSLVNNVDAPFQNVKVTFRLKDFMDFGTDTLVPELGPRGKAEIPLKAVLNNRILDVTEDTPIQAEFSLTYFENGRPQTVSLAKPLRVYSRNAITWDLPERIAAFVTSNDTPVKDFERKVMTDAGKDPEAAAGLPESLIKAMRLWHALGVAGIKFQPSANNPFEEVSRNPAFPVDYAQFPRETLRRKSGECDDLSSLLAALLESAGVKTALLDYPGHIAIMIDTGESDALQAGLPDSELVRYGETLWVPFEPTLVGSAFTDSYHHALNAYKEMEKAGKASVIDPRKAWATFEPATMPATDWSMEAPKAEEVESRLRQDAARLAQARYEFMRGRWSALQAEDKTDAGPTVQLGIIELERGNLEKAAEEFGRALAIEPDNAAALNNLGAVAFLQGDYAQAESWLAKAAEQDPEDAGIWLNRAKAAARLGRAEKAEELGAKAFELAPELKAAVQALLR